MLERLQSISKIRDHGRLEGSTGIFDGQAAEVSAINDAVIEKASTRSRRGR
jgi:hypothetical protein